MPLYRNILKQALNITWKYKYLWFFGLFAALLGNGGEYEIIFKGIRGDIGNGNIPIYSSLANSGLFSQQVFSRIAENPFVLIIPLMIWFVIVVLAGFMVWLIVTSQAALVNNSFQEITSGKKQLKLGIKDGIMAGSKKFWPVLGLNVIMKIIITLAFLGIGLPVFFSGILNVAYSDFLFVILFVIFIPIAVALSFIIKYAICFSVIKGIAFIDSIKQGWSLFKLNWLVSIEMAFILFFINICASVALMFAVMVLSVPYVFITLVALKVFTFAVFWTLLVVGIILLLLIIALFGSALATFQVSAWTGLFIELIGRGGESKISRVFAKK